MSFPHYTQLDSMDCGPTCLRIIAAFTVGTTHCKICVIAAISRGRAFRCWVSAMRLKVSV